MENGIDPYHLGRKNLDLFRLLHTFIFLFLLALYTYTLYFELFPLNVWGMNIYILMNIYRPPSLYAHTVQLALFATDYLSLCNFAFINF